MKNILPFVFSLVLIPVLSLIVLVYTDHTTRQAVISVLAQRDKDVYTQGGGYRGGSMLADVGAAFVMYPLASSTLNIATTTVATIAGVATSSSPTPPRTIYEYKVLRSVSSCTLSKFSQQGWQPVQFGGTLGDVQGFDANCPDRKIYDLLDWVLFARDTSLSDGSGSR